MCIQLLTIRNIIEQVFQTNSKNDLQFSPIPYISKKNFSPWLIPYTNFVKPNIMFLGILKSGNAISSKSGSSAMLMSNGKLDTS